MPRETNGLFSETPLLGTLRIVSSPIQTEAQPPPDEQLLARQVHKDAQQLVNLRYVRRADEWLVEALVYPLGTVQVEPVPAGPYTFASARQAERFLDEITLALEYLGCDVS